MTIAPDTTDTAENPDDTAGDDETFPRAVVEKLRDENAKYRQRAQTADTLAERLHTHAHSPSEAQP